MAVCSTNHSCQGKTCRTKKKSGSVPAPTDLSYRNTPSDHTLVSRTNLYEVAELDLAEGRASLFDLGIYAGHYASTGALNAAGTYDDMLDLYRFELGDEPAAVRFLEEIFASLPTGFADVTGLFGVGSPSFAVIYTMETENGPATVADLGAFTNRFVVRAQWRNFLGQEQPDQARVLIESDLAVLQGILNRQAPDPPTLGFLALRFGEVDVASVTPLVANGAIVERTGDSPASIEQRQIQVGDALNGLQNSFTLDRFRVTNTILEFRDPASAVAAIQGLQVSLQPVLDAQGVTGQVVSMFLPFLDETTVFDFARRAEDTSMAEAGITVWGTRGNYLTQVSIRDTVTVPADDDAAQQTVRASIREGLIDILTDYDDLLRQAVDGDPSLRLTLMPPIALSPILLRGVTIDVSTTGQTGVACETDADCVNVDVCTVGVCNDNSCEYDPVDDGIACGSGQTCCGGACIETARDNANCGACGKACAGRDVCCKGACEPSIERGFPCQECPCPTDLECHGDICGAPYPLNFGPIPTIDVAAAGFRVHAADGWQLAGGNRCLELAGCVEVGEGFFVDLRRVFDLRTLSPGSSAHAQRSVIPDGNGGVKESIVDIFVDTPSADEGLAVLSAAMRGFLAETGAKDFTGNSLIGNASFIIRVPRGDGIDLDIGHVAGTIFTLQRWSDFRGQTEVKQGRELAERKLRARSDYATALEQGQEMSLANAQVFLGDPNRVSLLVNQQYTRFNGITFPILSEKAAALDLRNRMDDGQDEVLNLAQPIITNDGRLVVTFDSTIRRFVDPATAPAWVANVEAWWVEATPGVLMQLAPNAPQIGQFSQSLLFFRQDETGGATLGQRFIVDSGGTIMDTRLTSSFDAALFTALTAEGEERTVNGLNDVLSLVAGRQNEALGSLPYNGGSSVDIDRELDRLVADLEAIFAAD